MKTGLLKRYPKELLLLFLFFLTFLLGLNSPWVERFYATGLYKFISSFFRVCFGWIPFSFGDLLYGVALVIIIKWVVRFIRLWRQKLLTRIKWRYVIKRLFRLVIIIYLVFQWAWGLNYHRLGSAYQLSIDPEVYTTKELIQLTDTLNSKLQAAIPQITSADSAEWLNFSVMKNRCVTDYNNAAKVIS